MAMSLAEAAKLTNDMIVRGVIETIVTEAPVLQMLPFMEVVGTALTYNREATLPTASFYSVGDTWSESTPTFTKKTASLTIMGLDSDVDQFIQSSYADPNDIEATVLAAGAKAVAYKYSDTFINGDVDTDPEMFNGLFALCTDESRIGTNGANGAALTLDIMDAAIDAIKPGRPDVIILSKRDRRSLTKLYRAAGVSMETDRNEFGQIVEYYAGVPLVIDDNIATNVTTGTSGDTSTIYFAKLGMDGIMGLQNSGGIQIEPLGALETKDARRHRIKWYSGLALFATLGVYATSGIRPA